MITIAGSQDRYGGTADVFIDISGTGAPTGRRHIASFHAPKQAQAEALARSWVRIIDAMEAVLVDALGSGGATMLKVSMNNGEFTARPVLREAIYAPLGAHTGSNEIAAPGPPGEA